MLTNYTFYIFALVLGPLDSCCRLLWLFLYILHVYLEAYSLLFLYFITNEIEMLTNYTFYIFALVLGPLDSCCRLLWLFLYILHVYLEAHYASFIKYLLLIKKKVLGPLVTFFCIFSVQFVHTR